MPEVAVELRPETAADFEVIRSVTAAAFGQPEEADLVEQIRSSVHYEPDLALVAVLDGEVVGHAMLSWCELHDGERTSPVLELAPVSVRPGIQRSGIGGALCRELLARAAARGEAIVCVLGHPEYYPRFGFEPAADHGIAPPDPTMAPAFFVAPLDRDAAAALRGAITFWPSFPT